MQGWVFLDMLENSVWIVIFVPMATGMGLS